LEVLPTVEDDGVILVIGFTVAKNRVTGKLDAEFGTTATGLWDEFAVSIN